MCRIASIFLLQRLKGSMSGDARSLNNMETRAVTKFPLPPARRCRRTGSVVSLEKRGLFMCRIASLFLLQRLKGSMSCDARDFNNMETRAVTKFPPPPARRRRRTGSVMSLEKRGLFMCQIASIFLLQRLKGSMSGDARGLSNMETRAVIKSTPPLPAYRQGAKGNSRHSDRNIRGTRTIVCHRQKLGGPV